MALYSTPQPPGPWHFACGVFWFPRAQPANVMPDALDYQRGLEAARADAKMGWARCWMPAAQLAEQAVYSCFGLSAEQLGYAAGLDEAFPGGVPEIAAFLDCIHSPGVLVAHPGAIAGAAVDMLATVVREGAGWRTNPFRDAPKQPCLARFVYVYKHAVTP